MEGLPPWPATIRVGYLTYRIVAVSAMVATGKDIFGECDNCLYEIRLREDLEPVKAANTMLHEVLHACWYVGGIADDDKEERTVRFLSNMLSQVWRDNPEWASAMQSRLTEQP